MGIDPAIWAAIITASVGAVATIAGAYIGRNKGRKEGRERGREEGRKEGYDDAKQTFQRNLEAAPIQYVKELDVLIADGSSEGIDRIRVNARAIVSARNSLRGSLETISQSLNSDIDRLSEELENDNVRDADLMETVDTLVKVWPAKKKQIDVEVRKALVEMGLLEKSAAVSAEQERQNRQDIERQEREDRLRHEQRLREQQRRAEAEERRREEERQRREEERRRREEEDESEGEATV